ncbi:MAG: hypothetical protein HY319_08380 [Armatimonadetes bacterium]|nr:hypothetical protein [Armatimonadota bacterium]
MSNPLLSALEDSYDDQGGRRLPEGTTIKGLVQLVEMWLQGRIESGHLVPILDAMAGTVSQAAFATERDIRAAGPMAPELREPAEVSLDAYRNMVAAIEGIQHGVTEDSASTVEAELQALRNSTEDLLAAQEAFQAWMESPAPACPRCGATDLSWCTPDCPGELFIPDREAVMGQSQQTATLGPDHVRAFEAYSKVVSGEARLAVLLEALKPLAHQLETARASAQAVSHQGEGDPETLEEVLDALLDSLDGIDQVRRAAQSRRMSDINQGWRKVFTGAVRVLGQSRELAWQADPHAQRQAFISTEDSVQISWED